MLKYNTFCVEQTFIPAAIELNWDFHSFVLDPSDINFLRDFLPRLLEVCSIFLLIKVNVLVQDFVDHHTSESVELKEPPKPSIVPTESSAFEEALTKKKRKIEHSEDEPGIIL